MRVSTTKYSTTLLPQTISCFTAFFSKIQERFMLQSHLSQSATLGDSLLWSVNQDPAAKTLKYKISVDVSAFRSYTSPATRHLDTLTADIQEPCASGLLDRGSRPGRTIGWDARWDWWLETNKLKKSRASTKLCCTSQQIQQELTSTVQLAFDSGHGAKELAAAGKTLKLRNLPWGATERQRWCEPQQR